VSIITGKWSSLSPYVAAAALSCKDLVANMCDVPGCGGAAGLADVKYRTFPYSPLRYIFLLANRWSRQKGTPSGRCASWTPAGSPCGGAAM
jgi:hypothetical protein